MANQRAKAHAKHPYFCSCGKVVHGNGAKAMHFYVGGDRWKGRRDGHVQVGREWFRRRFPDWRPADPRRERTVHKVKAGLYRHTCGKMIVRTEWPGEGPRGGSYSRWEIATETPTETTIDGLEMFHTLKAAVAHLDELTAK